MNDRDDAAASNAEHDDIPREPSKYELDEADDDSGAAHDSDVPDAVKPRPKRGAGSSADGPDDERSGADEKADDVVAEDDADADERKTYPPSRPALIAAGLLAAMLLALFGMVAAQKVDDAMAAANASQVEGVAKIFGDDKQVKDKGIKKIDYSPEEINAAKESWKNGGPTREMTPENLAQALNAGKPDSVTPDDIKTLLDKLKGSFITMDQIEGQKRSMLIMMGVAGVLMAVATFFYQRAKGWARFVGMFVAGFIAVMQVMNFTQGSLNIPSLIVGLTAVAAFYFLMKGRLEDPPAVTPGVSPFSLFRPRGPRTTKDD